MNTCGGNCACATKENNACVLSVPTMVIDSSGKCPCGKAVDGCCHKDSIITSENDAIAELCEPLLGKNVC